MPVTSVQNTLIGVGHRNCEGGQRHLTHLTFGQVFGDLIPKMGCYEIMLLQKQGL